MMDTAWILEQAKRNQTTQDNIAREYCQHLFLSRLYQQKGAEKIPFKGGTALRILWRSPRFSEDLDFSGFGITQTEIENKMQTSLLEMEREGLQVDIHEFKKTTGGLLGQLLFRWLDFSVSIQLEISQRKKAMPIGYEQTLVPNDFIPAYTILHLPQEELIREKIEALLTRAKPRDFFDLYFILRSRLAFQKVFTRDKTLKNKILRRLQEANISMHKELKQFLPVSHHPLLRNFESMLEKELAKALP